MMVELWTGKREIRDEDKNDMEDPSGYETSGVQLARWGLEVLVSVLLYPGSEHVPGISGRVHRLAHDILWSPHFSWWLLPSPLLLLFRVINSTINYEHEGKSFLPIPPCHDHELTPSTAYTKYSIIPRLTVSCSQPVSHLSADVIVLNSLHSHNYKWTNQ